jgi:hypothetical protein
MKQDIAKDVADADGRAIKGTGIGYAVNLVMDYGNGRQVTISGTLPLGAQLTDFNRELDKLRKATNRQQAYVILRDCEAKHRAASKMAAALEKMLADYQAEMEKEMNRLREAPESQHGSTSGKIRSQVSAQIENMRSQAVNFKVQKQQEIDQHRTNAEINEVTIASLKKEIEELDKEE